MERMQYLWAALIWYTSFNPKCATNMLTNKRNIVIETIAMMFLLPRSDVSVPRHLTSEPCEHTFGGYRCTHREFTVLQLIEMEEKRSRKVSAMYASNITTSRTDSTFRGYQATFQDFVNSGKIQSVFDQENGVVEVDSQEAAVDQIWPIT